VASDHRCASSSLVHLTGVEKERIACVQWCESVKVAIEFLSVLACLAMGVHAAHDNESVDRNKNCQYTGKDRLHDDENNASDGFWCLGNAQLFDKDKDAENGEHSDDLNDDVDPVTRF